MRKYVLVLGMIVPILGGCASYGQNYQQYLAACALPQNQKVIRVNGVEVNQGCSLSAPQDNTAAYLGLAGSIANTGAQAAIGIIQSNNNVKSNQANQETLQSLGNNAGNHVSIGGDGTNTGTGSGNSGASGPTGEGGVSNSQ